MTDPWRDRSILITGGTGSFGHAATARALAGGAAKVTIYSRDEVKQSVMRQTVADPRLRFVVGDVRDPLALRLAMRGIDLVLHAAALKQVPSCEYNPIEAVATNVDGTRNAALAALDSGVQQFVMLSTDKACNPTNLYGATKLCAEKIVSAMNAKRGPHGCRFSGVRYGNVAGSRGSVIPLWRATLATGAALQVTDPTMTRFWFTLDGAVTLVEQAVGAMRGGELFIPKLSAFRLGDLAAALWPEGQSHAMEVVGIRPGEKRHEAMLGPDEPSVDVDWAYCLTPAQWWCEPGQPVPTGVTYRPLTSDTAPLMDVAALRVALETV